MRYLLDRVFDLLFRSNSRMYMPTPVDFTIYDVLHGMLRQANEQKSPVSITFKGFTLTVPPGISWEDAVALWKQLTEKSANTPNVGGGQYIGGDIVVDEVTINGAGNISS